MIGRSIDPGTGDLIYSRDYNFVTAYSEVLPLGDIDEWHRNGDFVKWIESVMYYSFLHCSTAGVPRCWFLERLSSLHAPQELPLGLQPFFPQENVSTWIVIRHGNRVWPILVVGRLMFNNTWDEFCDFHGLKIGYRVVFACERRWVFNTFLFNENGEQMTYNWTDPADAFQQLYPVPDNLHTACLPSVFEHDASLTKFLCEYTTDDALQQAFTRYLNSYIEELNVEALVFKAANKTWTIPLMNDRQLNVVAFSNFCTDLLLQPFDFLLVGVCFDQIGRVIIFRSSDGTEKIMANWEFNLI